MTESKLASGGFNTARTMHTADKRYSQHPTTEEISDDEADVHHFVQHRLSTDITSKVPGRNDHFNRLHLRQLSYVPSITLMNKGDCSDVHEQSDLDVMLSQPKPESLTNVKKQPDSQNYQSLGPQPKS